MIRSFNYTKRKRLTREHVHIALRENGSTPEFEATLKFDDLRLAGEARVFVEAYHRTDWMRFDFGTVSAVSSPADRRLTAFYEGARIQFRVKVVDHTGEEGRILAETDRIRPASPDDNKIRDPLLPVRTVGGMGEEIWRVSWDGGPVLELNNREPNIKHLLTRDLRFQFLVLPQVLRTVLFRILAENMDEEGSENADIARRWFTLAERFFPEEPPEPGSGGDRDTVTIDHWINQVVSGFCSRHRVMQTWAESILPSRADLL